MKLSLLLLMAGAAFAQEKEPTVTELRDQLAKAKMEAQACEIKLELWRNIGARAWIGDMERGALERAAAQSKVVEEKKQ